MAGGKRIRPAVTSTTTRFEARITFAGRSHHLGRWDTKRAAAVARDRAILHFRLDRPLVFPRVARQLGPSSPERLRKLASEEHAKNSTSRYRGVSWSTRERQWRVQFGGVFVAFFDKEASAAVAYDRYVKHLGGSRALLNFPRRKSRPASLEQLRMERRGETRTSKYRGVYFRPGDLKRPWFASIAVDDKSGLYLGDWATEAEAGLACDRAARFYVGKKARLNFPRRRVKPADAETLRGLAQKARKATTQSKFRGVRKSKTAGLWCAKIAHQGREHHLGTFADEVAAAVAYDEAATRLKGDDARLNFDPDTGEQVYGRRAREMRPSPKRKKRQP